MTEQYHRDYVTQVYIGKMDDSLTQERLRNRIEWISSMVENGTTLDLGCSEGILPIILARRGLPVVGVDINPQSIEYAKEFIKEEISIVRERVNFINSDFFQLPKDIGKFNNVILGEVLEHFSEPENVVELTKEYLEIGGKLIVTTPYGYFPDPDHAVIFDLSKFFSLFEYDFTMDYFDIIDRYIRFVVRYSPNEKFTLTPVLDNPLLRKLEVEFINQQIFFNERISDRDQWIESKNKKLKQLTTTIENMEKELVEEDIEINEKEKLLLRKTQNLQQENLSLTNQIKAYRSRLSYQLINELKRGFQPFGSNTVKMPKRIIRSLYHWWRNKKSLKKSVSQSTASQKIDKKTEARQFQIFQRDLEHFIELSSSQPNKPVVIISTTTKRMGSMKRLNRTMAFASELSKMQIPVMYIYYRFRPEPTPDDYDKGYLLQLPNDYFHQISGRLSRVIKNSSRIFIASICDKPTVNEVSLFKLYNWNTIYEVRDDWEEFYKAGVGKWYNRDYEKFISHAADKVTCVSVFLKQKLEKFGVSKDKIHIIPNGLDGDFLNMSRKHLDLRKKGYKGENIIGYFGHLTDKWFNWDLVIKTAKSFSNYNFELIGFDYPENLNLPKNIKLLGPKTHEEIINYASKWKVGIIPFRQSNLARAVDPIKIYEYLSLGLPTVACLMDNIVGYPFTFIYQKDQFFNTTLQKAISHEFSGSEWQDLENFINDVSWKNRVEKTLSLIE